MKDTQLYLVIGTLVSIDLIVMTAWQIFDPFYRYTKELPAYVSSQFLIAIIVNKTLYQLLRIHLQVLFSYHLRL